MTRFDIAGRELLWLLTGQKQTLKEPETGQPLRLISCRHQLKALTTWVRPEG